MVPKKVFPPPAALERNQYGDFVVKSIHIPDVKKVEQEADEDDDESSEEESSEDDHFISS